MNYNIKTLLTSAALVSSLLLATACSNKSSETVNSSDLASQQFSTALTNMNTRKAVAPSALANKKFELLGLQEVDSASTAPRDYLLNGLIEISFGTVQTTTMPDGDIISQVAITATTACQTATIYSAFSDNLPSSNASHTINIDHSFTLKPSCVAAADQTLGKLVERLKGNINFVSSLDQLLYIASMDSLNANSQGILFVFRQK